MKLLFNGCSFVAGDFVTWDRHYPHINPRNYILGRSTKGTGVGGHPDPSEQEIEQALENYCLNLRPKENLAAKVAGSLDLPWIDISADGNSNTAIAQSTIAYLSENPGITHVCIGWTEPSRRLVWDPTGQQWINISVHRLEDPMLPKRLADRIKLDIISAPEYEHTQDYLQAVMLLNSYVYSRGIAITQWRSMGQNIDPASLAQRTRWGVAMAQPHQILHEQDWISWHQEDQPWFGSSWLENLSRYQWINAENSHPNLAALELQAAKLVKAIQPKI